MPFRVMFHYPTDKAGPHWAPFGAGIKYTTLESARGRLLYELCDTLVENAEPETSLTARAAEARASAAEVGERIVLCDVHHWIEEVADVGA